MGKFWNRIKKGFHHVGRKIKGIWHKAKGLYSKYAPIAKKVWNKTHDAVRWAKKTGIPLAGKADDTMSSWEKKWKGFKHRAQGYVDIGRNVYNKITHHGEVRNTGSSKEHHKMMKRQQLTGLGSHSGKQDSSLPPPKKRLRTEGINIPSKNEGLSV